MSVRPADIDHEALNLAEAVLRPALDAGRADDPALYYDEDVTTFAQLERQVNRFGSACLRRGLKRGERVLLLVLDKPELVFAYLGVIKAGGVAVALNVRSSAEDLIFAIRDSGSTLLVMDPMYHDLLVSVGDELGQGLSVIVTEHSHEPAAVAGAAAYVPMGEFLATGTDQLTAADTTADDMAFWVYTSGTTGRPKAAVHRQKAVRSARHYLGDMLGVGPGDRLYCSSKLFFAFSLGNCFLGGLHLGAAIVLFEGWPTAETTADIMETYRPTLLFSVSTFFRNMLRAGVAADEAFLDVRHFVSAGEHLPAVIFDRWLRTTGSPIIEGIGATETLFLFLANHPDFPVPGATGRATANVDVRLVDERDQEITEAGIPGVMWVRMDSLANGYWNNAEKTTAAFIDDWYVTGDIFSRDDDGNYYHQGRSDDMLKISGQWVSPLEIEQRVLAHPLVADCAVVGVPNIEGLIRLALFLVPTKREIDQHQLEVELQADMTKNLSIYKCPRRFFYMDELPRTATGKSQRYLLRQYATDQSGYDG